MLDFGNAELALEVKKAARKRVSIAAAALLIVAAAAVSFAQSGCGNGASEGSGASGASGSGTGGTGAAPATECAHDADCDDGTFCDGQETCVSGRCLPGTLWCSNYADHCDVHCYESSRGCAFLGLDKDGDGFVDKFCMYLETPGPDCDDSNPAVNPSATEVCNGIDDDCDGKVDTDDDIPLSNHEYIVDVAPDIRAPSIAWLSAEGVYGLVYDKSTANVVGSDVFYAGVALDGSLTPTTPLNVTKNPGVSGSARITASGSSFAIVWADDDAGSTLQVYGLRIQNGTPLPGIAAVSSAGNAASSPTVVADEDGGWAIFWSQASATANQLMRRRFTADFAPFTDPESIGDIGAGVEPDASRSSTTLGISWLDSGYENVWAKMPTKFAQGPSGVATDATIAILPLIPSDLQLIGNLGNRELVAADDVGFAFASSESLSGGGSCIVCDGSYPTAPNWPQGKLVITADTRSVVQIAAWGTGYFTGYLALTLKSNASDTGQLELLHFAPACEVLGGPFALTADIGTLSTREASLTVGDYGVAVAYVEVVGGEHRLKVRLFGSNLCD